MSLFLFDIAGNGGAELAPNKLADLMELVANVYVEAGDGGEFYQLKKIAHRGIWVEPSVLAEIEYRAKSAEGKVRHPFFKGVREDL
jgi:ATP-dependent DNA ligase